MRARSLIQAAVLAALLAGLLHGPRQISAAGSNTVPATPGTIAASETGLAGAINGARAEAGLPAMLDDPRLADVARARSQDMISRHYFSHVTPDGRTIFDLLTASAIDWSAAGENLGQSSGADPVQTVMSGFLQSAEHRNNLLSRTYGHMGVGVAVGDDGVVIVTAIFTN